MSGIKNTWSSSPPFSKKKHFRKTGLLLFAFWALLAPLQAQSQTDFTGSWKGTLTQESGGFRSKYHFELYLIQKGNKITGRSYVSVDDIYATLEIEGEVVNNKIVKFREIKFVRATNIEDRNMEWCYKTAVLELRRSGGTWRLEGPWEGVTSSGRCIPGKIYLTLKKPQA